MALVTLNIDGRQVTAEEGSNLLLAARRAGIFIPALCAHEDLPGLGACGLCAVEVDGLEDCPPACTQQVRAGMVVRTDGPSLTDIRCAGLQRILSEHVNPCLLCDHRHDCELFQHQPDSPAATSPALHCNRRPGLTIAGLAVNQFRVHIDQTAVEAAKKESGDPFIDRDYNLCVQCGLCWRACEVVQGRPRPAGEGGPAERIRALGESWSDAGCNFCGACVDACAGGALQDRYARHKTPSGHQPLTTCTICPQCCTIKVLTSGGRLMATNVPKFNHESRLCAVGRFGYAQIVNDPRRLVAPMIRREGELVALDWDKTLEEVAERLAPYRDGSYVSIIGDWETRENTLMHELFARNVMRGQVLRIQRESLGLAMELLNRELRAGGVKAAIVSGAYLDAQAMAGLELLIMNDFRESRACDVADAVLPVAILGELEGTLRTADNQTLRVKKVLEPPGAARAEWTILSDLAAAMGGDLLNGRDENHNGNGYKAAPVDLHPRDTIKDAPRFFRGHYVADLVPELRKFGLPHSPG